MLILGLKELSSLKENFPFVAEMGIRVIALAAVVSASGKSGLVVTVAADKVYVALKDWYQEMEVWCL